MLKTMITVKAKVKKLLKDHPKTRDCDASLYAYYLWYNEKLYDEIGTEAARKVVALMQKAPPPESIRRVRQKVQEDGDYRGVKWLRRKRKAIDVQYGIKDL